MRMRIFLGAPNCAVASKYAGFRTRPRSRSGCLAVYRRQPRLHQSERARCQREFWPAIALVARRMRSTCAIDGIILCMKQAFMRARTSHTTSRAPRRAMRSISRRPTRALRATTLKPFASSSCATMVVRLPSSSRALVTRAYRAGPRAVARLAMPTNRGATSSLKAARRRVWKSFIDDWPDASELKRVR